MKFNVYVYEGNLSTPGLREQLVQEAVAAYCQSAGIDCENLKIERTAEGKPYATGLNQPVEFSISHTDDMWIGLVGPAPCGIDLQTVSECKWSEISSRKFDENEQKFVKIFGKEGFFSVWTRREAYGKLTGEGLFGKRPSFVDEESVLLPKVGGGDLPEVYFTEIPISPAIQCVFCTTDPDAEIVFG